MTDVQRSALTPTLISVYAVFLLAAVNCHLETVKLSVRIKFNEQFVTWFFKNINFYFSKFSH